MKIPLSKPDVSDRERSYVDAALHDGWISGTGDFVRRFEQMLCARTGRAHTIATANGTLALELVLRGLGIGPGDEVIVPALTFAAPAMSVLAVGASVVLADITIGSWTIDPAAARARRTPRTRAIIAVDLMGHPADYDALLDIDVPVIQDAAEAHGARYKGKPAGAQGCCSVFSFHANKAVTTGEGGSVGTNDASWASLMRIIANHGMTSERPYIHEVVGRNYRMTNLTAALGLGQLDRWHQLVAARDRISARYSELLAGLPCRPAPTADWATRSCWLHTITLPRDRDAVLASLCSAGIDARAVWPVLDEQPILRHLAGDFPVAREVSRHAIWLPTYAAMPDTQIEFVAGRLADAIEEAGSSSRRKR